MRTIVVLLLVVGVTASSTSGDMSITLDHVDGLTANNRLPIGSTVSFYLRLHNSSGQTIAGSTNGFRLYSPDGATWSPGLHIDSMNPCFPPPCASADTQWYGFWIDPISLPMEWIGGSPDHSIYEGGVFVNTFSLDGFSDDTIGFGGLSGAEGVGIPGQFEEIAWEIRIDQIPIESVGKIICLDSSYYPPLGFWRWVDDSNVTCTPDWDGPHCFAIGDCCVGRRGNLSIGNINDTEIDIVDLTALVKYMFGGTGGATYSCPLAANVNGDIDESVDIADLTFMVNYMFKGGPEPAACP